MGYTLQTHSKPLYRLFRLVASLLMAVQPLLVLQSDAWLRPD